MNTIMLFFYAAILAVFNCKSKAVAKSAMAELKVMWKVMKGKTCIPTVREAVHALYPHHIDLESSYDEATNGTGEWDREGMPFISSIERIPSEKFSKMTIFHLRKYVERTMWNIWYQKPETDVVKKAKKGYLCFLTERCKVTILDTILYFCKINYVRELIYNNKWGFHVCEPKNKNYPEKVVIATVRDIILNQLSCEPSYMRKKCFTILANAPEYSFASKVWASIPNAPEYEVDGVCMAASGQWEKVISKLCKIACAKNIEIVEEIPNDDVEFWRSIWKVSDRKLNRKFELVS